MPVLEPKMRRALDRLGRLLRSPKNSQDDTCHNWALCALTDPMVDPRVFFEFVEQVQGMDYAAVLAAVTPINGAAQRLGVRQNELNQLRTDWAPHAPWSVAQGNLTFTDNPGNATVGAINTRLDDVTLRLTRLIVEVYGFTVSAVATDYQICMHYQRRATTDTYVGPNAEHWWIKILGKVCAETFPRTAYQKANNLPSTLSIYKGEVNGGSNDDGRVRLYVTGLKQEHINEINGAVFMHRHSAPFNAYNPQQAADTQPATNCDWCGDALSSVLPSLLYTPWRYCTRCGRKFCRDCTEFQEVVEQRATGLPGLPPPGQPTRVCITCTTQ